MASIGWGDTQTRLLINERKQRNSEYHATPKRKKPLFWDDIARVINEREYTNYFTGEDCNKKFLSLTKAFYVSSAPNFWLDGISLSIGRIFLRLSTHTFGSKFGALYTAKKYREGGKRKSLVGEEIYEEFSSKFWQKSESSSDRAHNENVRRLNMPDSSSLSSGNTRRCSGVSPVPSRTVTPFLETSAISRPVTPTLPSFSQSANVINVNINYAGASDEQQK